jgi:hypothetical protein
MTAVPLSIYCMPTSACWLLRQACFWVVAGQSFNSTLACPDPLPSSAPQYGKDYYYRAHPEDLKAFYAAADAFHGAYDALTEFDSLSALASELVPGGWLGAGRAITMQVH